MRAVVRSASGRQDDSVLLWLLKVESKLTTFDELYDTEGLGSLDTKLCAALLKIFEGHGDLLLVLGNMDESMLRQGKTLTGRQVLHLLYQQFVPCEEKHAEFILNSLLKIRAGKIGALQVFLASWDSLVAQ